MPYIAKLVIKDDDVITEADRRHIDEALAEFQGVDIPMIGDILRGVPSGKIKGAYNYFASRVWLNVFFPEGKLGYTSLSDAIGVLPDMEFEFRRRLLAPYEDEAIVKNGDLPEFEAINESNNHPGR